MKALMFILFLTLLSCSNEDDVQIFQCSNDCTTLNAQFVTKDGEGVPGVRVLIDYGVRLEEYKNIVNEISDENGNIFVEFFIDDEYLSEDEIADAQFRFTIDDSQLNNDEYIRFNNNDGNDSELLLFSIPNTFSKDTVFNIENYFPKKSIIKIRLDNFEPLQNDDFFKVYHAYPFGSKVEEDGFLGSNFRAYANTNAPFLASGLKTTYDIYFAEGENNLLTIVKQKNGEIATEDIIIEGPLDGENQEYIFEY